MDNEKEEIDCKLESNGEQIYINRILESRFKILEERDDGYVVEEVVNYDPKIRTLVTRDKFKENYQTIEKWQDKLARKLARKNNPRVKIIDPNVTDTTKNKDKGKCAEYVCKMYDSVQNYGSYEKRDMFLEQDPKPTMKRLKGRWR